MRVVVTVGWLLLAMGCGEHRIGSDAEDLVVLVDNSGSIPPGVQVRIENAVCKSGTGFVERTSPGSQIAVWSFCKLGAQYPAQFELWTMPVLKIPAHRHRRELEQELGDWVSAALEGIERVKTTPILESLFYVAGAQTNPWILVLVSDLEQDSPQWNSDPRPSKEDEQAILELMQELCPRVNTPPGCVVVKCWPGLGNRKKADLHAYETAKARFMAFFEEWCPEAEVKFEPLM